MEKVVVPQFVADYIEKYYGTKLDVRDKANLIRCFDMELESCGDSIFQKWVKNDDNLLTFITAIITNDYEVEEEKEYYWKRKSEHSLDCEVSYMAFLNYDISENNVHFNTNVESGCFKTKFTEKEVLTLLGKQNFDKLEKVEITE